MESHGNVVVSLLEKLKAEAEFGELELITVRVPVVMLRDLEEIAEQLGITRSEVIRETMLCGLRELQGQIEESKPKKSRRQTR